MTTVSAPKCIGQGDYGHVYWPALVTGDKNSYISKILSKHNAEEEHNINQSLDINEKTNFTVKYMGSFSLSVVSPLDKFLTKVKNNPDCYRQLVYEYWGYDLENGFSFTFDEFIYGLDHLFEALVKLENTKVAHRDILPKNVLYNPETTDANKFKLIDFGIIQQIDELFSDYENLDRKFPPEFYIHDKYSDIVGEKKAIDDIIKRYTNTKQFYTNKFKNVPTTETFLGDSYLNEKDKSWSDFSTTNPQAANYIKHLIHYDTKNPIAKAASARQYMTDIIHGENTSDIAKNYVSALSEFEIAEYDVLFSRFRLENRFQEIQAIVTNYDANFSKTKPSEPEIKNTFDAFGDQFAGKCDVYMMGMVLLTVALKLYKKTETDLTQEIPKNLTKFLDLVHGMTYLNPVERFSPKEAKDAYLAFKQSQQGGRRSTSRKTKPAASKSKSKKAVAVKETVDRKNNPKPTKTSEKVLVCKRERTVYKLGRRKFVRVKGSLVPLTDARKMKS